MNKISIIIGLFIISCSLQAQKEGHIKYKETIKLEIDLGEEMEAMKDMFPDKQTFNKDLFFNASSSVYRDSKDNENTDQEIGSEEEGFKIVIKRDDAENIFYTDHVDKKFINQTGFMGKTFLIEETMERPKWVLTGEKVKYLGYECHKATLQDEDKEFIAWFTPEIPVQVGPDSFSQLPGAILMLTQGDQSYEIMATEVNLRSVSDEELSVPTKGKKVTVEEYDKIVDEKTKEMEKMSGGNRIMIRN